MIQKEKRILRLRILLGVLIICNMAVVFLFSSQSALKSALLSQKVTINFVELIPKDYFEKNTEPPEEIVTSTPAPSQKPESTKPSEMTPKPEETKPAPEETTPKPEVTTPPPEVTTPTPEETTPEKPKEEPENPLDKLTEEQVALVNKMHTPIRKLAHMIEFGSLAFLVFLFLLTWQGGVLWRYVASLGFAFVYAVLDEWHQLFEEGRGSQFSDVIIDSIGAFITCTLLLIAVIILRSRNRIVTTRYNLSVLPNGKPLLIGLVTDLHTCPHEKLIARLRKESPDLILLVGDMMENMQLADKNSSAYAFFGACAKIAPTYYSFGNHETIGSRLTDLEKPFAVSDEIHENIAQTGVILLHNESAIWNGIRICGLTSGLSKTENRPNEEVLAEFAKAKEFRILLCHHPEYYEPYIQKTDIDLTVSGHAHGGQWRFFGRGFYAPGQGFFPKYTAGVIENRFVISRGAGDHTRIPRFCNPRELVIIRCGEKEKTKLST